MKRAVVAFLLILTFVLQGTTSVLAGTTGSISGSVVDASTNQPVGGARVTAASPSQTVTTTADGNGRYTFVSLAPDTYTVTVAAAGTYDTYSLNGVTVQADQNLTVLLQQPKKLRQIGQVTSRAASALVKPGTTTDVYSISAAQQDKSSTLGGGGLLNSAWSAITSVPGVYVAQGSSGYVGAGSGVSIRGGDYDQIGYELDGIPVNRSYDNYPSSQLSALGQQELQVYTGAAPANSEGQGISGYINQVIKTGTSPAYRSLDFGIGTPTMYNKLSFETGGANPSRTFSYYVGLGGYNQDYRNYDNFNGASLAGTWGAPLASCYATDPKTGLISSVVSRTAAPSCYAPNGQPYYNGAVGTLPGTAAYALGPMNYASLNNLQDRDSVVNLHFGIPQKDGNHDDVQLLWDNSHFDSHYANSTNDIGGPALANALGLGGGFCADPNGGPCYIDGQSLNAAPGSFLPANYNGATNPYYFPYSSTGRQLYGAIPLNQGDSSQNDMGVLKLQYQHNFGTTAFLRVYGYTYYSDWLENGPQSAFANYVAPGVADYSVGSHTRGGSVTFSDQLTDKHLLTIQGNYTTASVFRDNSSEWADVLSGTPYAVLVDPNNLGSGQCYNYAGGAASPVNCYKGAKLNTGGASFLSFGGGGSAVPAGTICGTSACQYLVINNGQNATYNSATPKFLSLSLTDNWKPTDKLTVNYGVRFDQYQFTGADTYNSLARQFLFAAYNSTAASFGDPTLFNPNAGQTETFDVLQPRVGLTYTLNPATVVRASYGRYAQPPLTAFEQYNYLQPNAVSGLVAFDNGGLGNTFMHRIVPPVSNNFDLSLEHQFSRDLSVKLTPFLRQTQNQIEDFVLDQKTNFVSGVNVGNQRSQGVELEVDKGDFARNGLAARLSFAYTNSYIRYSEFNGTSVVDSINTSIQTYNQFTSACAVQTKTNASLCGGVYGAQAMYNGVANPYYNAPAQGLLSPNGNYATFSTFPVGSPAGAGYTSYGAPYAGTLMVQYKHDKFAFTPAIQFSAGLRYGVPITTPGVDPTSCAPIPGTTRYDAPTCTNTIAIPNQYTGNFDGIGQFVQPTLVTLHLQTSYDVSKRVTLVANFANLFSSCFGGSKVPWSVGGACSYGTPAWGSGIPPVGNVYNPGDAIQPILNTPYGPSFGAAPPFNMYFEARLKI
jgi:TonB dependent receptor/Carboxypeptidase regulatory-like domain/TonB-dependent Receptor Plug Domain